MEIFVNFQNENLSFRDRFEKKLSFQSYETFSRATKQCVCYRDMPEPSCLCEVCKNACLVAKGINKSLKLKLPHNLHDLVERFSCSRVSHCMNSKCDSQNTPPQWEILSQRRQKTKSH